MAHNLLMHGVERAALALSKAVLAHLMEHPLVVLGCLAFIASIAVWIGKLAWPAVRFVALPAARVLMWGAKRAILWIRPKPSDAASVAVAGARACQWPDLLVLAKACPKAGQLTPADCAAMLELIKLLAGRLSEKGAAAPLEPR